MKALQFHQLNKSAIEGSAIISKISVGAIVHQAQELFRELFYLEGYKSVGKLMLRACISKKNIVRIVIKVLR